MHVTGMLRYASFIGPVCGKILQISSCLYVKANIVFGTTNFSLVCPGMPSHVQAYLELL